MVIGLTGGIACGKSTVARTLKSKDAIIIDADRESKQLMKAGSPIWTKLIAEFGREILNPDNTINRRRLGNMVFGDGYKLKKLNSIVHPGVIEQIAGKIRRYKEEGRWPAIVLDAPLLYEVGAEKLVDFTWVVAVDRQTQINRLLARDKITPEQASQRIEAQMPLEEKVARADAVINNTGSRRATREMVYDLWNQYVERG
ncbi:MAG TPA: dephospho-CoA kinase [Firmicutes bacterium]|nr:dephospho-CoA kinase [Bacillota bacterium]HBS93714.1 dephospho-CoA kinase [Bacillota bacterium]